MIKKSYASYISEYNSIINAPNMSAKPLKAAVLRSFSCEALQQLLTVDAYERGFFCKFYFGGFGQYAGEILDSNSALYDFAPDITLLAVNIEDVSPLVFDAAKVPSPPDLDTVKSDVADFIKLVSTLRSRIGGTIIICNFVKPSFIGDTYYDSTSSNGFVSMVRLANTMLLDFAQEQNNVYIFDIEALVNAIGRDNAYDTRQWYLSKEPYKRAFLMEFSESLAGLIAVLHYKRKKCIVVDLDNTLWHGIVGEDGLSGIEINDSYKDFQKQLLFWKNSGILLAVNSKNNYDDAIEVFVNHPDMVLRKDDFACFEINWNDKAQNLNRIAEELNIGLDSMIFIDDSEFECEFVRLGCPAVEVIRLDGNYINYAQMARNISSLNYIYLSDEDTRRTNMYKAQVKRKAVLDASASLTAYLESLSTELDIKIMTDITVLRAAQLTQKTNQFNLTTKRYTADDLSRMQSDGFLIFLVGVKDKFGDNGISGLVMIDTSPAPLYRWRLDNFLLSCRVMGRGIEKAVWAYVVEQAQAADVKVIKGEYIPTEKNKPVEGLLAAFGFVKKDGAWEFDVAKGYTCPNYITINS